MYRDPRRGFIVRMASSWDLGQTSGPNALDLPVVYGRTAEGMVFTLHKVHVWSELQQAELSCASAYLGAMVPALSTFRRVELWLDHLHEFFGDRTFFGRFYADRSEYSILELPRPIDVGSVRVTPENEVTTGRHFRQATAYSLQLESAQPHRLGWWLDQWVNPLVDLLAICVGKPSTATLLSAHVTVDYGGQESEALVFVSGQGWPTLDLASLPPAETGERIPLLLSWHDDCFELAKLMTNLRRIRAQLAVPMQNYRATIYGDLSPGHEFLNLIQSVESLHSITRGRHRPSKFDAAGFLARLAEKGVSSADRKRAKGMIRLTHPADYSLADRIQQLLDEASLPAPPDEPPSWTSSDDEIGKREWSDWIARARNDIAHGNANPAASWLKRQNHYLRALVEWTIMRELGLSVHHSNQVASRRHAHLSKQYRRAM